LDGKTHDLTEFLSKGKFKETSATQDTLFGVSCVMFFFSIADAQKKEKLKEKQKLTVEYAILCYNNNSIA